VSGCGLLFTATPSKTSAAEWHAACKTLAVLNLPNYQFVNPTSQSAWNLGGFQMLAEGRGADGESGDFFAFRLSEPNRLAVVIGDVCGHGHDVAPHLRRVAERFERLAPEGPAQFLMELNRELFGHLAIDRFVTSAAYEVDRRTRTLTVANAGHVPAILRRANGAATIVGRASGPPLGVIEQPRYFEESVTFDEGDVMVLMTDGIVEAVETDLTEMPKLLALTAQSVGSGWEIHRHLLGSLSEEKEARDPDDMTLLSLELMGEPPSARCWESHRSN
jgi:serine phosphatase RsbU (regulator of sigma subunit)